MRKVVVASLVGTSIEWYDFFLYGSAAALVFNKLFFPEFEPLVGTLLALTTYSVGFVARPVGGLVFGHFGDIVGRKKMLVVSLVAMGVGTFAIGLLPTYVTAGVAAPILLVVCRLLQGFAVGGEWGGAILLAAEHGSRKHRGFWSSWPQVGVPAGQVLAVAVLTTLSSTQSDSAFESWGWRVPFLLSAVLVVVGLWVRFSLTESSVFVQARERARSLGKRRRPTYEVIRRYPRELVVALGAKCSENVTGYVVTVFVLTYATEKVGLDRSIALNAVLVASIVHAIVIPLWGALSDRVGRRPVYIGGAIGVAAWAFVFFPLVDTKSPFAVMLAVTGALICHGAMYGPQAAFFSEMFGTSVRYSGASIGSQLASVFAGSLAPLISVALLARFDSSIPVSVYLVLMAVVTVVAVAVARETAHRDLAFDRDGPAESESKAPRPTRSDP